MALCNKLQILVNTLLILVISTSCLWTQQAYALSHNDRTLNIRSLSVERAMEMTNTNIIKKFFHMQNEMAPTSDIRRLFADQYQIVDLASMDVDKHDAVNIEKRIANFREKFPGYHVEILRMMSSSQNVFVWFKVQTKNKSILLNSFVLFTLSNAKIVKAIEMVAMHK